MRTKPACFAYKYLHASLPMRSNDVVLVALERTGK